MNDEPFPLAATSHGDADLFDLEAAAELSGMHPEMILEFGRARIVRAVAITAEGDPRFDSRGIYRLRQIEILRQERSLSLRALRYIVALIDRLDAAETELRILRERVR